MKELGWNSMLDQAMKLREIVETQARVTLSGMPPHRIAIMSGKGGVGKSNLALNMGYVMASKGARVLLIDGNINLSNLDILTGSSPVNRLVDIVDRNTNLSEAMTELRENLYLIAGSADGTYRRLGSGEIASLFNEISNFEPRFNYVIVDTAAGIVQESISFGILCDDVYIVSTPEPTAVMDAYVLVKALKRINSGSSLKLLINNVVNAETAREVKEKFDIVTMRFLNTKIDYAGCVLSDEAVVRAVNVQTPLVIEFPDSKAAKAIEEITSKILERGR